MLSQDRDEEKNQRAKDVLDIYQGAIMEENQATSDGQKAIIQEMCNVVWRVLEKPKTTQTNQWKKTTNPRYDNYDQKMIFYKCAFNVKKSSQQMNQEKYPKYLLGCLGVVTYLLPTFLKLWSCLFCQSELIDQFLVLAI
jgi:hypothetical protein